MQKSYFYYFRVRNENEGIASLWQKEDESDVLDLHSNFLTFRIPV
jgi:hypothetical protein